MSRYHGGKARHGKIIANVINEYCLDKSCYCEPFSGMLGVYKHIINSNLTYLAGDTNKSVILMWKEAQKGWVPPTEIVTREEFWKLKSNGESSAAKGFIGCAYGYAGNYFHSYNFNTHPSVACKKIQNIVNNTVVKKVDFRHGDYTQFSHLRNAIIYCDPPYQNSIGYKDDEFLWKYRPFNHEQFWRWIEVMNEVEKNNLIFVSEYTLPPEYIKYSIVLQYNERDNGIKVRKELVFKIEKI